MSEAQLAMGKKGILVYWASVILAAIFFSDTTLGYYHVAGGVIILLAHVGETFLFNGTLQELSDNVTRDKLLMLPYGFMVPAGLKLAKKAAEPAAE